MRKRNSGNEVNDDVLKQCTTKANMFVKTLKNPTTTREVDRLAQKPVPISSLSAESITYKSILRFLTHVKNLEMNKTTPSQQEEMNKK